MISTVTTSTVSIVLTVATAGPVALVGVLVLLILLIQKELSGSVGGEKYKKLEQILEIGIAPLLIAFMLIVITHVAEMLR